MSNINNIFIERKPSQVTFARSLRMNACSWGIVTEFYLESVKVNWYAWAGGARSVALIKLGDKRGKVTALLEGSQVATLFGVSPARWSEVERLASSTGQLFYRYFKLGLDKSFPVQQQLFYHFCSKKQIKEPFFIAFQRVPNTRKGEKTKAFLKVLQCSPCTPHLYRLFSRHGMADH